MMGSYKFPESFKQLIVIDRLEGKVLVADAKLHAE